MTDDVRLAADLAERAGRLLLDLRGHAGGSAADLAARGDRSSNDFLAEQLAATRPEDAVLSEESADDPARVDRDRVWIIDPLDGTREFALGRRSDWAVHVALWERGREISAAAVALPALGAVHTSDDPLPTAELGGGRLRIVVSDSRPPEFADTLADALDAELLPMGSAGAKAMAVLRGNADAYVHAGGQYEWDSAAPVGVVLGAGLHASRIDGTPARYNQPSPYLPDLLICRKDRAGPMLNALRHRAA